MGCKYTSLKCGCFENGLRSFIYTCIMIFIIQTYFHILACGYRLLTIAMTIEFLKSARLQSVACLRMEQVYKKNSLLNEALLVHSQHDQTGEFGSGIGNSSYIMFCRQRLGTIGGVHVQTKRVAQF